MLQHLPVNHRITVNKASRHWLSICRSGVGSRHSHCDFGPDQKPVQQFVCGVLGKLLSHEWVKAMSSCLIDLVLLFLVIVGTQAPKEVLIRGLKGHVCWCWAGQEQLCVADAYREQVSVVPFNN